MSHKGQHVWLYANEVNMHGDINQDCMFTAYDIQVLHYHLDIYPVKDLLTIGNFSEWTRQQMNPQLDYVSEFINGSIYFLKSSNHSIEC